MTWVVLGHTFLFIFELTISTSLRNIAPAFTLFRCHNRLDSRTSSTNFLSVVHKDLHLKLCSMLCHLLTRSFSWGER